MEPKTSNEPGKQTEQETAQRAGNGEAGPGASRRGDSHPTVVRRVGGFVRRHPALSLLAAGVGVVAAPEVALGALLGAGAVMMMGPGERKRLREQAGAVREEAGEMREEAGEVREEAGEVHAEARGRTREMIERAEAMGREVRARARAVMQAARGKIPAEPQQPGPSAEPSVGEEDWEEVRDQPQPPPSPAM